MFNTYVKNKAGLNANLQMLEGIAVSGRIRTACQLLRSKLAVDAFSLVVVGQFKRGKTTFINALIGKDLLPSAIIPLTSIITVLRYGDKLSITTFFDNGIKKEITLDDLPQYVTEKNNPKNEKNVNRVEITLPSPYLKNGVQIIDTPGVASVYERNTTTTYKYLPLADVAIFLTSVDPPLTQAELLFLRDLKGAVVKTFFIQNKIDTVSAADQAESLRFSKEIIESEAGFNDVTIYPLSAKEALVGKNENDSQKIEKSGITGFEQSLERFLIEDKGRTLLISVKEKANNFLNEEILLAELEKRSLQLPLDELEKKITLLNKFILDSAQEKIDSERLFTEEVRTLQNEMLARDLENLKNEKTKWLVTKVEEIAIKYAYDSNSKFVERINVFIDTQIRGIFGSWRVDEEMALEQSLNEIFKRFTERMNRILNELADFSTDLLGIAGQEFRIQETFPSEIEYRFETNDETDMLGMTIDLAIKALPKVLAHKLIIKEAREKAGMMIDRHCGKARYDFSQRMEQLIKNYRLSVTEAIQSRQNEVLNVLKEGMVSRQSTTIETAFIETRLRDKIITLQEIKTSIGKVQL
jgi:GTPase Era involved in 16S rRNA processing